MDSPRNRRRHRPVIRVFVSSTFGDLKHERDALQRDVFPKLEKLCLDSGFQFQAIDLRWGVPGEAGLDHRTMRICFEELRRSQEISPEPNFLILLGNRYGWRPLPEEIPVEEFKKLETAGSTLPIAVRETAAATLRNWYLRDDNNVPPVYILQSRERSDLNDGKNYARDADRKDTPEWLAIQALLWDVINVAFPAENLASRFTSDMDHFRDHVARDTAAPLPSIVRFQASATEQEIWRGALSVPDAGQHVLAFVREIDNLEEAPRRTGFKNFVDSDPKDDSGETIDRGAQTALAALKNALRTRLGANYIKAVTAQLVETQDVDSQLAVDVSTAHVDAFCTEIHNRLEILVKQQIAQYWRVAQGIDEESAEAKANRLNRELEIEREEHCRFGEERGPKDAFVGRDDKLRQILEYVKGDSKWPLVVHGASGCGKTALLARAAQEAAALPICRKHPPITRFIGVTPHSSDLRPLLVNLCHELRQRSVSLASGDMPADINDLINEFQMHLRSATVEEPVVLFLDALDQLSDADSGRRLRWIPFGELPGSVKIVVSCLSDRDENDSAGEPFAELKGRRLIETNGIDLDALSIGDAESLVFDYWFPQANRELNKAQMALIERCLQSKASRQPLYLKLLFEETRLWRSYDKPAAPGGSVAALLGQLFGRLEKPENHGATLVRRALGYLAAARRGLSETEMLEVLFADKGQGGYWEALNKASEDNRHELPTDPPRIPIAIWSRLRADLAPYLTERAAPGGNVVNIYHRQVAEYIRDRYLSNAETTAATHLHLADYFESRDMSERRVDELPWQLSQADSKERLKNCIADLDMFLALHTDTFQYELMAYCRQVEPTYDMAVEYGRTLTDYEARHGASPGFTYSITELAAFFNHCARYADAEPLFRRALEISELRHGPEHAAVGSLLNNLAGLLHATNRLNEAEPLFRRAVQIAEKNSGSEHPTVLLGVLNLANLLHATNQLAEAESLIRQEIQIGEKRLGPDHPDVAAGISILAQLLHATNRLDEAESMFRRALQIYEEHYGPGHPTVAEASNDLAWFFQATKRQIEAEHLMQCAIQIDEKIFGPEHPSVARGISNLGVLYYSTNRLEAAEPLYRRALDIYEKIYGPKHTNVARVLNNLAQLFQATDRRAEAEPLMRRALDIFQTSHGQVHPDVAECLSNIAVLLHSAHRSTEAEPLMRRAVQIYEKSYGSEHPKVAKALSNLAGMYSSTNRLDEVEPLYRRALDINESSYGPEHLEVGKSLRNLALLLETTGRFAEAEPLSRRALDIFEKSFGSEHPEVLAIIENHSRVLWLANRPDLTENFLRYALECDAKRYEPEHPSVAMRLNNLAEFLQDFGRFVEAEPLCRRALDIYEKSYGPEHLKVAKSLDKLACLFRATNRPDEAVPLYHRALQIYEKRDGRENLQVAITLDNLARLLVSTNRFAEAEPLMRRLLDIYEKHYGLEDPIHVALVLNNLAFVLEAMNRAVEAEPLYRRALQINEKFYGPVHLSVATGLSNLATLLQAMNRVIEADEIFRVALDRFPDDVPLLGNYAFFLQNARHDFSAASKFYASALRLDANDSISHSNYGGLCISMGDERKAEYHLHEAWRLAGGSSGNHSAHILILRAALATLQRQSAATYLGQIKTLFSFGVSIDTFQMSSVRDYLREHLPPADFTLVEALFAAIYELEGMTKLSALPAWQAIQPRPLDEPWP